MNADSADLFSWAPVNEAPTFDDILVYLGNKISLSYKIRN